MPSSITEPVTSANPQVDARITSLEQQLAEAQTALSMVCVTAVLDFKILYSPNRHNILLLFLL